MNLKKIIRHYINKIGYDLHQLNVNSNPSYQLKKALDRFKVDLVFDVGANTGQFGSSLRAMGFNGTIVSFEPLSAAHKRLTSFASTDPKWIVHPRGAIGNIDGEIEINIAGNSVSSSILPMLDSHSSAALESTYIGSEKAPIYRLDSAASSYIQKAGEYFIKIDTQGYESQVLDGAQEILLKARGVLCELSLIPLYEGQQLWLELIHSLELQGFTLWAIQKGFTDHRDGRTLQIDAIFFRL